MAGDGSIPAHPTGWPTGGSRDEYPAYITPAILLTAAASATQMIAVWISMDMSAGIIARFRTMAIARSSVLAGHVDGGTILITVSIAALLGFALGCQMTSACSTISCWGDAGPEGGRSRPGPDVSSTTWRQCSRGM